MIEVLRTWFDGRARASRLVSRAARSLRRNRGRSDPAPILAWRDERGRAISFKAELIGLDEVRDWSRDAHGNIRHKTGQFFGVEGVRIESGNLREVASWDQPIYTQPEGGILGLVARETAENGVQFLLYAKAEPEISACFSSRHPFKAHGPTSDAHMAESCRRCWKC